MCKHVQMDTNEVILSESINCFKYILKTRKHKFLRMSFLVSPQLCTKLPDPQYSSWYADKTKSIRQHYFLCYVGLFWNSPSGQNRGRNQTEERKWWHFLASPSASLLFWSETENWKVKYLHIKYRWSDNKATL